MTFLIDNIYIYTHSSCSACFHTVPEAGVKHRFGVSLLCCREIYVDRFLHSVKSDDISYRQYIYIHTHSSCSACFHTVPEAGVKHRFGVSLLCCREIYVDRFLHSVKSDDISYQQYIYIHTFLLFCLFSHCA